MTSNDLWFEVKPSGMQWLLPAGGLLLGIGLLYWAWPLTTILSWIGAAVGLILAASFAWLTWISFQDRARSVRFYRDRAEIQVSGQLRHALKYSDCKYVVYGTRGENMHSLTMMGDDDITFGVAVMGRAELRDPGEASSEDVIKLRDHLWKIIANHVRRSAASPAGYEWMEGITIVRTGLRHEGAVTPWTQIDIHVDETANKMTLMRNGEPWTWAWLSARNIVPIIEVLAELMEADAKRSAPRVQTR